MTDFNLTGVSGPEIDIVDFSLSNGSNVIEWGTNVDLNYTATNIYRSLSNDRSTAELIGTVYKTSIYVDGSIAANTTYYYWLRTIDTNNRETGDWSHTALDGLEVLSRQVEADDLSDELQPSDYDFVDDEDYVYEKYASAGDYYLYMPPANGTAPEKQYTVSAVIGQDDNGYVFARDSIAGAAISVEFSNTIRTPIWFWGNSTSTVDDLFCRCVFNVYRRQTGTTGNWLWVTDSPPITQFYVVNDGDNTPGTGSVQVEVLEATWEFNHIIAASGYDYRVSMGVQKIAENNINNTQNAGFGVTSERRGYKFLNE